MECKPISFEQFLAQPFKLWEPDWLLLTSGELDTGNFNCMTISWGSLGIMWGKPFIMVVVRPHRYTYQFMEQYPTFTVCAFPEHFHRSLSLLGSKSGRDGDKISEAGLSPQASTLVASPSYAEAELIIECEKMYWHDYQPNNFLDQGIDRNYPKKDYHRSYFGHILTIRGTEKYVAK
jgi:flavin reductase (DIM6/NTAB) family NADH-FMN oxidoreductase RutF